jgi:hypothetical protein
MKRDFPEWDFSLAQGIYPPTSKTKVNLFFPEEKFSPFAEGPRILESRLSCEIELTRAFDSEKPALEVEIAAVLQWLERHRFLGKIVLNSQAERIDAWEDYNGDRPLAYGRVTVSYITHQNLLEAS